MNTLRTGLRTGFRNFLGTTGVPQDLNEFLGKKISDLSFINTNFINTYYYPDKKAITNSIFIDYITRITNIINEINGLIKDYKSSISNININKLKECIHAIYSILGSTILDDSGNGIKISDSADIKNFYNNLQTKYEIPLTPPSQPSQLLPPLPSPSQPNPQPSGLLPPLPSPSQPNPPLLELPSSPSGGAAAHMKIIKRKRTLGQRKKRGGQELGLANNPGISEFSNTQYLNITPSPLNNLSPIDFSNIPQPFSSGLQPFGASIITQNNQLNPLLGGKASKGASKASKGASKASKGASKSSKGASKASKGASEAAAMRAASMMKW